MTDSYDAGSLNGTARLRRISQVDLLPVDPLPVNATEDQRMRAWEQLAERNATALAAMRYALPVIADAIDTLEHKVRLLHNDVRLAAEASLEARNEARESHSAVIELCSMVTMMINGAPKGPRDEP